MKYCGIDASELREEDYEMSAECGYNYNFEETSNVDCLHNSTKENQKILRGQARKSARGMPWHQEPMKDVTSCDKLRGGANIR